MYFEIGSPGLVAVDRDPGPAELAAGEADELDVVEPGLARRPAPAAEEAVDLEGVVGPGVELDLGLGPVLGPGDGRRPPVAEAVDVDLGAAARSGLDVLGLDESAEPVAGVGPDRDGREPGGVCALLGRDRDAPPARAPLGGDGELGVAGPLPAAMPPTRGVLPVHLLERAVGDELLDARELVLRRGRRGLAGCQAAQESKGSGKDDERREAIKAGVHRSSSFRSEPPTQPRDIGSGTAGEPRAAWGNVPRARPGVNGAACGPPGGQTLGVNGAAVYFRLTGGPRPGNPYRGMTPCPQKT